MKNYLLIKYSLFLALELTVIAVTLPTGMVQWGYRAATAGTIGALIGLGITAMLAIYQRRHGKILPSAMAALWIVLCWLAPVALFR